MREGKKWSTGCLRGLCAAQMGGLISGGIRFAILAFFVALVVGLDIDVAYAANNLAYSYDGVVYGPSYVVTSLVTSDYNSKQWVIVNAPDKFSAAVYAVGGNPADLDATKKALLSNASTGGDFYTFSGLFVNLGGSFDYPSWMGGAEKSIYRSYEGMYGEDNVFVAAFTPAQQYGAASDYGVIAGGGSLGGDAGSSGGGSSGGEFGKSLVLEYCGNADNPYGDTAIITFTDDIYETIQTLLADQAPYEHIIVTINTDYVTVNVWVVGGEYSLVYNGDNLVGLQNTTTLPIKFNNTICYGSYIVNNGVNVGLNIYRTSGFHGRTVSINEIYNLSNVCYIWYDGSNNEPTVPPTNWPDDNNVAPTQPDIPDPQEPVIDNQPVQPMPETTPTYPTYTTVTVNNFTADLQGILDAMDEHCIHLQNAIWWNFNQFWQKLGTKLTNDFATMRTFLSQQFSWIVSSIDSMFESLKDYLEDLAEWLRDELNYTISGSSYDDNTLLSWLKKIYYKLGNGNVSTKPVDPNANPDGVGDWISQLLANLFTALDDLAGGLLTSLATLIGGLVTKFPFSIPWDVAAILGLLVATPQAPNFDVPVYVFNGTQLVQAGTYEIDLDAWTPYLTGIHMMIKVSFILFLLLKTKDFMTMMEKAVGLGA